MVQEEFYKYFDIPKIEYREPGRTVDVNGEICEWYESECYPPIYPVYFLLLSYYNVQLNGTPLSIKSLTEKELCDTLMFGLLNTVKQLKDNKEEKQDIRDIFSDYYEAQKDEN